MIKKILFATDFSPLSSEALRYAAGMAHKTNASIVGLHALKPPTAIDPLTPTWDDYAKTLQESNRSRLQGFFSLPELQGIKLETRLGLGLPEQLAGAIVAKEKADLIVVAKHSRSALERFFVGSSTEKILREARCPVLVVPDTGVRSVGWNPITCAIDFSQVSLRALHFAIHLTRQYKANLLAIYVVESESTRGIEEEMRSRLLSVWTENARDKLENLVSECAAPQETTSVAIAGKPSAAILQKAQEAGSDLLVVGSRGHSLQERTGIGSTTNAILRSAHLPVLVVPG